jgi:hypothetical protein
MGELLAILVIAKCAYVRYHPEVMESLIDMRYPPTSHTQDPSNTSGYQQEENPISHPPSAIQDTTDQSESGYELTPPPPLLHIPSPNYPVDSWEQQRRNFNKTFRKICAKHDCHFLKSGKVVFDEHDTLIFDRFSDDGLHLSNDGIVALGYYFEGNVSCLMDKNKKIIKKKAKAKINLSQE